MSLLRNSALLLSASLALSCAGLGSDGGGNTDGGPAQDGSSGIECDLDLVAPAVASVNTEIEVGVEVFPASLFGSREFQWTIDLGGIEQTLTELADPLERVSFTPTEAGPYQVVVNATIGGIVCTPAVGDITVTATGALSQDYRMRVVPPAGPMQDFSVRIYGGADSALPDTQLEAGTPVAGRIQKADSTGVPAYLRARKRGTLVQTDYEGFSSSTGNFSLRLPNGRYDLMIVPSDGLSPSRLLEDLAITDLAATITLPVPEALSGHVLDAGGAPVSGALVSLNIDGAATTSALSTADGSFTVQGTSGGLSGLTVAPVVGSGMPALRADALTGQNVTGASDVVIRYANATVTAEVDLTLAAGGAAAGAQVEWRATLASAATVNVGASESVSGNLRVSATADGSGHAQSTLAAVNADLVAHSSDAAEGRVVRDLNWAASPTTALALSGLISVSANVTRAEVAAVGASLIATPLDVLAPQSGAQGASVAASGLASLSLVRGGNYEVVTSDSVHGSDVRSVLAVDTGMPALAIELPGTILASGYVSIEGAGAAGAQISLHCDLCTGDEATRVLARAVANGAGRYVLRVADPGIAD